MSYNTGTLGACVHLDGEADAYVDEGYEQACERLFRCGCECGWMTHWDDQAETIEVYHCHRVFTLHHREGCLSMVTYRNYGGADERVRWKANRGAVC